MAKEKQVKKHNGHNGDFSMLDLWGYITKGLEAARAKDFLCAYRCFSEANCLVARTVHGKCPSGAPEGGFWVKKADMANIVGQKDSFASSQFQGFPAQNFIWIV